MSTQSLRPAINRRDFLLRTGWLAAGTTVLSSCTLLPVLPTRSDPEVGDGAFWIQALPDGQIRFLCPRMEMGQGASIGLTQVVAEELNLTAAEIVCVTPSSDQVPPFKMTVGSDSVREFFEPVAHAAALLRETLRRRAAKQAGITLAQVADASGGFLLRNGDRLTYGDLTGGEPVLVDAGSAPKSPEIYSRRRQGRRAVGIDTPAPALEDIVTGRAVYSRDAALPDMLYGGLLRPPSVGARLREVDDGAARRIAGVHSVVVKRDIYLDVDVVGVIAETPFVLDAALAAIEADWTATDTDVMANLAAARSDAEAGDFEHELDAAGGLDSGRAKAAHRVTGRYETTFLSHAIMEPRAAVVSVEPDKVEVWCGTQAPFFVRGRVARLIGRSPDDVVVHPLRVGGGFGGRVACQASEEAALLSAAAGRPVRVQWSREDEFRHNYFQPPFLHLIEAGLTKGGRISHWQHDFTSSPIMFGPVPSNLRWAVDMLADEGTARGGTPPYRIAHKRVRYSDIRVGVTTGAWRGLGAAPNAFAIESAIDELAVAGGLDPLAVRLANLGADDDRLAGVLREAARIAGWGRETAAGSGLGIACAIYKETTYVAVVAEVRVDHGARQIRVDRIWCAQDCGLVVNPDQVKAQAAGCIVWGCGMALKEQVVLDGNRVDTDNFHTYEIMRQSDMPEIEISLVEPHGVPPAGAGEPAIAPTPAAIANAVYAATGKRVRRLPFDYESLFG